MDSRTKAQLTRRSFVAATGGASALALGGIPEVAAAPGSAVTSTVRYQDANPPTPREGTVVIETDPVNVWDSFNPFIPNGEA